MPQQQKPQQIYVVQPGQVYSPYAPRQQVVYAAQAPSPIVMVSTPPPQTYSPQVVYAQGSYTPPVAYSPPVTYSPPPAPRAPTVVSTPSGLSTPQPSQAPIGTTAGSGVASFLSCMKNKLFFRGK